MYFRNALVSSLVLSIVSMGTSLASSAFAAEDTKSACLAAADTGQSLRDDGQYAIAREQFVACARDTCPRLVHDQCADWLKQLDEATPTVIFAAKDEQGHDVNDARVLMDGKLVTSNLDGKPMSLDPGPHDLRFEHDPDGFVTLHVVVRTAEKNREVTATFPTGEGKTAAPAQNAETSPVSPGEEPRAARSMWNARIVTSGSLLAGGVVAVGLGAFFGLQSQSENSQAQSISKGWSASTCNPPDTTHRQDCANLSSTRDAQNRDAIFNEVLYITGGALAVAAVATWFLWPKGREEHASATWVAPTIGPAQVGVGVGGAF